MYGNNLNERGSNSSLSVLPTTKLLITKKFHERLCHLFQIEVVAETVVEARVQKTEETAETLTKTCRGLEEDLASECENRFVIVPCPHEVIL